MLNKQFLNIFFMLNKHFFMLIKPKIKENRHEIIQCQRSPKIKNNRHKIILKNIIKETQDQG